MGNYGHVANWPSSWGTPNAEQLKWWNSQSQDNKNSWATHASIPAPVYPKPVQPTFTPNPNYKTPAKPAAGGNGFEQAYQTGLSSQPQASGLNYQTGMNANGQAINSGHVLGRLGKESGGTSQFGGVNSLRDSLLANQQAQLSRGMAGQNSQEYMNQQAARSQLYQQGMSNMAQMYQDMAKRGVDQMSLATQIQKALLQSTNALGQALTSV